MTYERVLLLSCARRFIRALNLASLLYGGLPRLKVALSLLTVLVSLFVVWALESLKVDEGSWNLPVFMRVDPIVALVSTYLIVLLLWTLQFARSPMRRPILLAGLLYVTTSTMIGGAYVSQMLTPALWFDGSRPESHLWLTSHFGFFNAGEGVPSAPLVMQLTLLLTMAATYPPQWYRSARFIGIGCVVVAFSMSSIVYTLSQPGQRVSDLILTAAVACLLFAEIAVVPFAVRSGRYYRVLADVVAANVVFHVLLFFYSDRPALMLSSAIPFTVLVFVILGVRDWTQSLKNQTNRGDGVLELVNEES